MNPQVMNMPILQICSSAYLHDWCAQALTHIPNAPPWIAVPLANHEWADMCVCDAAAGSSRGAAFIPVSQTTVAAFFKHPPLFIA